MSPHWVKFECKDYKQDERIEDLLKRNRRISALVQQRVLGYQYTVVDGDLIEDALQSNLGTMHQLERILKERAG